MMVADFIVSTLVSQGVDRIYGITGDSLNSITDSVFKHKSLQWIHTRHEEAAAFAAGADSTVTNQLTVCAGSSGPGNLHLINGLYDCQRNKSPVLAIAAQIPSTEIGSEYFQETDPRHLFKGCSVFCETISRPDQAHRILSMAIQCAREKRGVSVVIISGDIADLPFKNHVSQNLSTFNLPSVTASSEDIHELTQILNSSKKITLFCGYGCADARDEILEIASKLQSPIVHSLRAKEFIEHDNPFDVGMTGFIGFSAGYSAMHYADVLIILGSSFPYRQFYPKTCKIIQVDLDPSQLGRRTPISLGIIGSVKHTLRQLMPFVKQKDDKKFLNQSCKHYINSRVSLSKSATIDKSSHKIHPQMVFKLISDFANDNAIFTCDVGTPTVWSARYLSLSGDRRLLGSFNHGSMANALSQGIGAQCADLDRQVIALCGDGGFSMLMGDLLTLKQHELPLKVLVLNNRSLGFVELEMKANGFLDNATQLENPDFSDVANSCAISGFSVKNAQDLEAVVKQFLACPGPALLNVDTIHDELIIPPHIDAKSIKGFCLYQSKALLNHRGNEVIELALDNIID